MPSLASSSSFPPHIVPEIKKRDLIALYTLVSQLSSSSSLLHLRNSASHLTSMALLLFNIHPKPPLFITHHRRLHSETKTGLRLSTPNPCSPPGRRVLLPPPKSASINGISVQNVPEISRDYHGEEKVELFERLRRWIGFVQSVLPGGSWWSFSDDIEIRMLAEPVTVSRALLRMWQLVAQDRWVIFAAFGALILAAVRACQPILFYYFLTKLFLR